MKSEPTFETRTNRRGEFYSVLKAPNGKIIARSESYTSRSGCMNGIGSVKRNAAIATVKEKTDGTH